MNWIDVFGIIIVGALILVYMVVMPMVEGQNKGKKGNQFGVINDIGRKIKDIVRWMNRQ